MADSQAVLQTGRPCFLFQQDVKSCSLPLTLTWSPLLRDPHHDGYPSLQQGGKVDLPTPKSQSQEFYHYKKN